MRGAVVRLATAACVLGLARCLVMPEDAFDGADDDVSYSLAGSLRDCLDSREELAPCLSRGAVAGLARADAEDVVRVAEGVSLALDDDASTRTVFSIDKDPTSLRTLLDALSTFLSRRSLRWDLGLLYPGLMLKVAQASPAGGVLEFELDSRLQELQDRNVGTGRLLIRRLLLPLIVGTKISLAAVIPLFFLAVAVISKKALLLSKLAVIASGFLGLNSLFLLQQQQQQHWTPPFLDHPLHLDRRPPQDAVDPGRFARLSDSVFKEEDSRRVGGRNFVWEDPRGSTRD